jgi:ribosomal-protein-alanine acetyltransferase
MSFVVRPLSDPRPTEGSVEAQAIVRLEAATQARPLPLASLLRDAAPDASGRRQGVVLLAHATDGDRSEAVRFEAARVVGMASARMLADEAHVMRLAVDDTERRQGVGRSLLDGLVAWAREQGAAAVVLEVRADNVAAQALYASAGFVTDGRRPRYYPDGEDALLCRRSLPDAAAGRG